MVLAIIEIALLVICLVLLVIFVYQNHTKIRVLGEALVELSDERQMLIDWTIGLGKIVFERTYDYREKFKQIGIADSIIDTLCDYYEQKNDV